MVSTNSEILEVVVHAEILSEGNTIGLCLIQEITTHSKRCELLDWDEDRFVIPVIRSGHGLIVEGSLFEWDPRSFLGLVLNKCEAFYFRECALDLGENVWVNSASND